uniref:Uncharacterized protein n=1 Tax=Glossina austeni TaxID=7395 RepID=A0A1A9V9Y5_GLOAU
MNFLKIFAILLLTCHESVSALEYSDKLKAFEDAVNDAKRELENLKSTVSVDDEDDFRHRRKSVDHIFENFDNNLDVEGAKDATTEGNKADWTRGVRGNFPYIMEGKGRLLKALRARDEEDAKHYNFNAALFNKWGPATNFRKGNALSNSNILQHVKYLYVPATNNYVHIKGMVGGGREYANMNGGAGRGNIGLAGNYIGGVDDSGLAFHKSDYSMASLSRNGPDVASFASTNSPFKTDLALSLLKPGVARNKGGDEINLNYRIPPASKSMMSQSTIYGSKMDDFRNYGRTTQFSIKEAETTTEGDANRIMYEDGLLKPEAMNAFAYLNRNHFRFDIATTTERTDYSRFDKEREELENSLRPFKYPIGILRENITESPYEDSISPYFYGQTEYKFPEHILSNAQTSRLYMPLNDQFETKKNNLSHEADYKLSKMEQDASERFQGHNVRWGNGEVIKRSSSSPFNPMNEIKLKTSRRLMKKGYGPSLPSYSLSEARKEMLIDHMLHKKEQEMNRGVKRTRNRMSDSFSNEPDFYYDSWMDGNERINDDENMGIHSNDAGMDDFDMRNIDYVRQKRISHVDRGLNKNSIRKFKKSRSDQATVNPAQGESNKKAAKSKTTQEQLKSSERTESAKDEKMVKNEKTYKNDGMGNEKDKHSGKGDQDAKVRHKKKKEEKEKGEKKEKLEKVQNNERIEEKDKLEEKDKTEKTEKPITKTKSKTDQNGKLNRLRTQRHKDKYKTLKPGRFNKRVLVAQDEEGVKLQNEDNSLEGLSHDNISPDFDYTDNIEGIIDRVPDHNRQFAADTDISDLKPGGSLEFDSGLEHLMNGAQRIQRDTVGGVAGVSSHGTNIQRRKRSAAFKMKNDVSSIFDKVNSVRGSMTAKDLESLTKQVGVDYNQVVNPATMERSIDYISNLKDRKTYRHDFQDSYGSKMRQKRSLGTEREDFREELWDFDTFELNEDNIIQRFKRSLKPKPELIQKPHRIKRRNAPYFTDDYLSKANYQAADVDDDPRFLDKLDRQKEETIHDFDFDSARKSFGREEFDNLKQKDPKFAKFSGMKFDNVKWDKSYVHEREQKSANDKKAFMEMMSDETRQRNNDISTEMKKSDRLGFHYNLPRSSDAISDEINGKTLQEAFNTGIKPDYRNFWLATGNTKREDNKSKDNKQLEDKVRKDSKDDYLKDINDFNRNYKFNENHFNWGQHYNNFGVENSPYLQNWLTNKQNDDGLSIDMHNDLMNYSAFTSLDNFLKTMPRNNTLEEDSQPTSNVICDTGSMPVDLITTTTPCITTTKENSDSTTECVTTESSAPTTVTTTTTTTTEAAKSGTDAPSKEEECITNSTELTKITTTTASAVTTECEEPSEKSTEKTSENTTEEEEATTECVPEGSTEVPPTSSTSSTGKSTTSEGGADDELKLNITINANVLGKPKQKTFLGNGSIQVMPGYTEDRNRRETYATPFEELKNRKSHHHQSKACMSEHEDAEDLSKLASGKLSSQIVKSVFCMVKNDPNLKALWPSLKRRQPGNHAKTQDLYAIRNENNEGKVQNSENMLRKAMDTINCIVEEQVRSRNCVPLRPDLQDFYETVLRSNQEQDKCREKRDYTMANYDDDFSKQVRALDPNKIEEKSRIVKKLLKQYEELPQDDQEKVVGIRDDLLKDLLFLRKLKESEERRRRELFEKKELGLALDDDEAIKRLQSQYTPQFLKLLKTSDLYREMATEPDPIL